MGSRPLNLELNPSARISICDQESSPTFLVKAPVKGASLSFVRVCAENMPGVHAFLYSILIDGHPDVKIGEQDAAELRRIGLFAPVDALPQTVVYQFPLRVAAHSDSSRSRASMDDLAVKASHQSALRIPAEWPQQSLRFEAHHHGSIWSPVKIACGAEFDGQCENKHAELSHPGTALDVESTHVKFDHEGFAILQNLLPSEHVREMGEYFQALAAQGFLVRRNDHGSLRFTVSDHPVARFWHDQLNERVTQLAGRQTKPSYSFVSLYAAGGSLHWHTDIPQCEYTISLLLDYAPLNADGRSSWALKLEGRDGTAHSLHQRVGEALIFKGRELSHGRDVLPDGHRSASLLFHFVNEDFEGELG